MPRIPRSLRPRRRDLVVAALAALAAVAATRPVHSDVPLMRSAIFVWEEIEARPTKVGWSRRYFQAPTATLDELESHVTTINPGEAPHPPHQHPEEELIVIKEGLVESTVGELTRRVGPGSVIFQASNEMHGLRNVGHTPATYHVIKWKAAGKP